MTNVQSMIGALVLSAHRYPNCPIANCDCHHKDQDEWVKGCYCLCHFAQMDKKFGKGNWGFGDTCSSANAGMPRRKPGPKVLKAVAKARGAKARRGGKS